MSINSPASILFNQDGYELASKDGYAVATASSGLLILGSDGSNARYLKTDALGRLTLVGAGVAGTPAGGVVSIQGVAGGTNLPISGTVSATQSGTWNINTLTGITNVVHVDDNAGSLTVDGTVGATQSGTWDINNISGTISLPTGAATAANQSTEITSLQLIDDIIHSINASFNKAAAIAGQLDDVSTTLATEDGIAPLRITAQRGLHVNIRNASGSEMGTSGAPFRTDPTGTTVQPVNGTVTSNQGGTWNINNISGTISLPTGAATETTLAVIQTQQTDGSQQSIALGRLQSGSYPDPSSYDTQEYDSVLVDGFGNLQTRGVVLTDEGSYRDDFSGSSLTSNLTGTVTFTNGGTAVTGVGTLFTSELKSGMYVRLSSHTNTFLTQIDYIESDTSLVLISPYGGANGSGTATSSNWYISIGTGASQSISSSILGLASGTTSGSINGIYRSADYLPFVLTFQLSISQRISDQKIVVGFEDIFAGAEKSAFFMWDGTSNSSVTCVSSFASDSIESTVVTYPGVATSATIQTYEISITPNTVVFIINDTVVATHKVHLPGPYDVLNIVSYIENTGIPSSSTTVNLDALFFQNTDQVQLGGILNEAIPVQGVAGGTPITIQFGNPGGGTTLPTMINVNYNKSDRAIISSVFKRVATYSIPAGYNGYIIRFVSFQGEAASSRVVAEKNMGTQAISTNTFTTGAQYTEPQWTAIVQAEVTTAIQAGAGNVVLTVTYTNELGVSGKVGTITIPRGSVVGSRWDLILATGDLGVRSIQSVTNTPSVNGVVKLLGLLQLGVHQDQSTTTQTETLFAPGAITFPSGTVLGLEYAGGTVSKNRNLDLLVQLVQ